jgi:prepilin-type N-terminal cleavage/methylation domain-containing protein
MAGYGQLMTILPLNKPTANCQRQPTQPGFTLIELLLYVAISSIMLLAISSFLGTLLQSRVKNQTIAEVEQQGLAVTQLINQTARNAQAITAPTVGANAASATLNVITGASNPTIFDISAGVLRIKEGAGAAVPLTNSRVVASGLNFQNLSRAGTPGTIRVQFTLTHVNNSGRNEYSYAKTFITSATLYWP